MELRKLIRIFNENIKYKLCDGDLTESDALTLVTYTWPSGITPLVHYSESKRLHENNETIKPQAHSDYINVLPETHGFNVDIEVEAKEKELAILPHLTKQDSVLKSKTYV